MRVIECNECGETLQAANDAELVGVVGAHMQGEHDEEIDEEELAVQQSRVRMTRRAIRYYGQVEYDES